MPSIFDELDLPTTAPIKKKTPSILDDIGSVDVAEQEIQGELRQYEAAKAPERQSIIDSLLGDFGTGGGILTGITEVGAKSAASLVGTLAGAVKGVGTGIVEELTGGDFSTGFSSEVEKFQQQYNYTPKSATAKAIVGTIEEYITEPVNKVSNFLGDEGFEIYDSPLAGAAGQSLIPAAASALGFSTLTRAGTKSNISTVKVQEPKLPDIRTLELPVTKSQDSVYNTISEVHNSMYTKDVLKKLDEVPPGINKVVNRVRFETEKALTPQYFAYDNAVDSISDLKARLLTEESNTLLKTELDIHAERLRSSKSDIVASYLARYEEVYGPINNNQLKADQKALFPELDIKKATLDRSFFVKENLVSTNGEESIAYKKLYQDISPIESEILGRSQAGKFMAERHPLVKTAVSALTAMSERTTNLYNQLMYRPAVSVDQGKLGAKIKSEKTDKGALYVEALPVESQKKVVESLLLMDKFGIDPAPSNMKIWGLNAQETKAVLNLREGSEVARKYYNDSGLLHNKNHKVINYRYGYVPHIFMGDYRVFVRDSKNDTVHVEAVGSEREAQNFIKTLPQGFSTEITRKVRGANPWEAFAEAVRIAEQVKPSRDLQNVLFQLHQKSLSQGSAKRFTQERIGVSGFLGEKGNVKEFLDGYKSYMNTLLRSAELVRANKVLEPILTDSKYNKAYPNAVRYIHLYKDNNFNVSGSLAMRTRDVVDKYYDYHKLENDLGKVNRAFSSLALFFFNPGYLAQNILAPFLSVPPRLFSAKLGKNNIKEVGKTSAKAMKSIFFPSDVDKEVLSLGVKAGVLKAKFMEELSGNFSSQKFLQKTEDKIEKWTGAELAARADTWSRSMSLLMFYKHLAKTDTKVDMAAFQQAKWLTNKHMVEYETRERPIIFNERGTGVAGKAFGLFSAFPSNWLSHQLEYVRGATKDKDYKPMAASLALQALAAGAAGTVLWNEVDFILEKLGYPTASDKLHKLDPTGTLVYGPLSTATGADMHSKLRAPTILDNKLISVPALEWVGGLTGATLNYLHKASIGSQTPDDERDMWKSVMPKSFAWAIEVAYTTGENKDIVRIKEGVRVKREIGDWYARIASLRSIKEKKLIDSMWSLQRMERNHRLNADSLLDAGAYIVGSGSEIPDWWLDSVIKQNIPINQVATALRKRILDTEMVIQDRLAKMGKTRWGQIKLQEMEDRGNVIFEQLEE